MLRLYIPLVLMALFSGWILYRLIVKRDLKSKLNYVYPGLLFIGIWGIIYFFVLKP